VGVVIVRPVRCPCGSPRRSVAVGGRVGLGGSSNAIGPVHGRSRPQSLLMVVAAIFCASGCSLPHWASSERVALRSLLVRRCLTGTFRSASRNSRAWLLRICATGMSTCSETLRGALNWKGSPFYLPTPGLLPKSATSKKPSKAAGAGGIAAAVCSYG
jgi:hypothetical protein